MNEFPWLAGVARPNEVIFCGSALIASRWVVAAAHCVYSDIPLATADLRVVVGEYDSSEVNEEYLERRVVGVSLILLHYYYDPYTMHNDIALLRLDTVLDMNVYTPVCLPPPGMDTEGKSAWVYGKY